MKSSCALFFKRGNFKEVAFSFSGEDSNGGIRPFFLFKEPFIMYYLNFMQSTELFSLWQKNWPSMSPTAIIITALILVLCIAGLVVYTLVNKIERKRKQEEASRDRFNELSIKNELDVFETELLRKMLRQADIHAFDAVFENMDLFERCVDKELSYAAANPGSFDDIREHAMSISRIRDKLGYQSLSPEKALLSTRELGSGQHASVRSLTASAQESFAASVVNVNELEIVIKMLPKDGEVRVVKKGDTLAVLFTRSGDAEYSFQTTVIDLRSQAQGVFVVQHPTELKRRQLRGNVRIDVKLPLKLRIIRSDVKDFPTDVQEVQMLDLSAGGVCFKGSKALHEGDTISVSFDLPTGSFRGIVGRVLRIAEVNRKGDPTLFKHHVQFINIDRPSSDKIVRHIFNKLREESQWR